MSDDVEAGHPKVKEFCREVWETHKTKNSDYSEAGHDREGDVFSNFQHSQRVGVSPLAGVLVRMTDKYDRVCNIYQKDGENAVEGEGFGDALLDLAGYAAIAYAMWQEPHDSEAYLDKKAIAKAQRKALDKFEGDADE